MRTFPLSLTVIALSLFVSVAHAEMSSNTFTTDLSLGSRGSQVTALQQVLNQDPNTRIATTGPGSPGQETDYFGLLTKTAVIRFQEKYTSDILVPAGLTKGNGYVRANTRAKLNALSVPSASAKSTTAPTATTSVKASVSSATSSATAFLVKDGEKTDIYIGDRLRVAALNKMYAAINATIASRAASRSTATATLPAVQATDYPSVVIGVPSPRTGLPGSYISLKGSGISANSVIYFGSNYIVRKMTALSSGSFSFVVPPIPAGHYDLAVKTGVLVSNTTDFVITDPKSPPVHIQSVSPSTVAYGSTLTITGSGFSPLGNKVITTYQTITGVPSTDGKTLTVTIAPDSLREYTKFSKGAISKPMSVSVVNDNGFSDSEKSFTMTL